MGNVSIKQEIVEEKPKILAIDDDPMILMLLADMLSPDYCLQLAKCAADAEKLITQNPPNLILLDIQMPGISGFQLLQNLKKSSEYNRIPVIIVSGHIEIEFIILAEQNGASSVVAKPINKDELLEKIKIALTGA